MILLTLTVIFSKYGLYHPSHDRKNQSFPPLLHMAACECLLVCVFVCVHMCMYVCLYVCLYVQSRISFLEPKSDFRLTSLIRSTNILQLMSTGAITEWMEGEQPLLTSPLFYQRGLVCRGCWTREPNTSIHRLPSPDSPGQQRPNRENDTS